MIDGYFLWWWLVGTSGRWWIDLFGVVLKDGFIFWSKIDISSVKTRNMTHEEWILHVLLLNNVFFTSNWSEAICMLVFFLSLELDNFTKCWSFLGQSLVQIPKSYQALLIRPLLSRTFMSFWNSTMTPSPRPTGARVFPGGPGPTCRRRRTHTAPADTAVASPSPPTSRSLADGFVGCSWGHHLRVCAYMINK